MAQPPAGGVSKVPAAGGGVDKQLEDDILKYVRAPAARELARVVDEMHALGEEQRAVWRAYDTLKWGERWGRAQGDSAR